MSIILNIDTSIETASISIAGNGVIMSSLINTIQKEHASFLQIAIKKILADAALDIKKIDAIAVTNGPGSYTGLRVGLASAKGLCYALNKPLITIGTLNALAVAAIDDSKSGIPSASLFCPMIDARRMEVYTAVFDMKMTEIQPPCAMVLDKNSLEQILTNNQVFFVGSGADKWKNIVNSENAGFIKDLGIINSISKLSYDKFLNSHFTDLTYSEPLYIKEFFST